MAKKFRVLKGISIDDADDRDDIRYEPGDIVEDLPAQHVGWLTDLGAIEAVPEPKPKKASKP